MVYVYAITDPIELDGRQRGLDDAPLEATEHDGIAGVFSQHDELEIKSDPELLWAHERVIDHLMEMAAVLPLRFGTVLEGPDALQAVLAKDASRFRLLLSRVRGCVELAVRVGLEAPPPEVAEGGADYMRDKLAARRQETEAADSVLAPLRPLARATAHRHAGNATISESFLVPRSVIEPFAAEVRALQARNPGLSISCTGPWGPYSFVDGGQG
jgi:gas vesicle protein GvpL/GvpF